MPTTAQMVAVPDGPVNHYTLGFRHVTVAWTMPSDMPPMPIAINWGKLGEDCDLITIADITFRRGIWKYPIPRGYEFDGASIPRLIRWMPGYQRVGRHLWAALIHDYTIDDSRKPYEERVIDLPRAVADALFITLLLDTGVAARQSRMMHRAVRLYSAWLAWTGGEADQDLPKIAAEASKAPVAKAEAVQEAAEVAKSETSVAPCKEDCDREPD